MRHARDGGVPDDNALRGAQAGDVGVQGVEFRAGVHHVHAAFGNMLAGVHDHAFELRGELRLGGVQRREVKKQRLNQQRGK